MKMREIDHYGYDLEADATKIVIRCKTYDLKMARALVTTELRHLFGTGTQTLYKTPDGHYFVVVHLGMGLKPKVIPRTLVQARAWLDRVKKVLPEPVSQ